MEVLFLVLEIIIMRFKLAIQYDGTDYHGSQVQPSHITVQEVIETVLTKLNSNQFVRVTGCGRTDTGVHASYYVMHFDMNRTWDAQDLGYKISCMLPEDIAFLNVEQTEEDFHARFDALSRSYEYYIIKSGDVFWNRYAVTVSSELDLASMNEALKEIIGEFDFKNYARGLTPDDSSNCNLMKAEWSKIMNGYRLDITANRFLRNMVRRIVGASLLVGKGEEDATYLKRLLVDSELLGTARTAPAKGLRLSNIVYP